LLLGVTAVFGAESQRRSELDKAFPSGGVSVDFRAFHDPDITDIDTSTGNLISNGGFEDGLQGWGADFWTYLDKRNGPIGPMGIRRVSTDTPFKGKYCGELGMPDDAALVRPEGRSFSNNLNLTLPNPSGRKQAYQLSFYCRGVTSASHSGKLSIYIPFSDPQRKNVGRHFWGEVVRWASPDWQRAAFSFTVPEGAVKALIQFRFTNFGRAWIDEVRVAKITSSTLFAALIPYSFIDDTFCISSGQAGILNISIKNSGEKLVKPVLHLRLPRGIDVIGVKTSILDKKEIKEGGRDFIEYSIPTWAPHLIGQSTYGIFYAQSVLLRTDLPVSEEGYQAQFHVRSAKQQSPVRAFTIRVLPPVSGRQPARFQTGGHTWNDIKYNESISDTAPLAELYAGSGFNVIQMNGVHKSQKKLLSALKQHRVLRYSQELATNGYSFRGKIGESEQFRRVDNSWKGGACPTAIYGKGELFTDHVVPEARRLIVTEDLTDSIMSNWELFMYDSKGCFCQRCKGEFREYSKLPGAEVEKAWPKDIIQEYKDMWVNFRSFQHARVLLTMETAVNRIGAEAGKASHFVPEISVSGLVPRDNGPHSEHDPRDYLGRLPIVQAWGPYLFSQFTYPYTYRPGYHLSYLSTMAQPKAFVAANTRDQPKATKLIAFPLGISGPDWIQEPEALAMEHLTAFLSGWDGSILYFFPNGYDARYWQALAKANTQIAENESFVFDGTRVTGRDRFRIEVQTPVPEMPKRLAWEGWEKERIDWQEGRPAMIQGIEYTLQGRRLFAVGNFWQRGEVFLKIIPQHLEEGKYVLRQPLSRRCFGPDSKSPVLSRDDLERGVLVQAGALRWAFFVLEPWAEDKDYGDTISPAQMSSLMGMRLAKLRGAYEEESLFIAEQAEVSKAPDFSNFKPMKEGAVVCGLTARKDNIGKNVVITWPGTRIAIDPYRGAKIVDWQTDDITVSRHLGVDAIWIPKKDCRNIDGAYQFGGQETRDGKLCVTFSKKLLPGTYGYNVGGLGLTKTYSFANDSFSVRTRIENLSDHSSEFAFRFHNLVSMTKHTKAVNWTAEMLAPDGKAEILDPARGIIKMFRLKRANAEMDSRYPQSFARIASDRAILKIQDAGFSPVVRAPDKALLYGLFFWGFSASGIPSSSLEPIFEKVSLAQGQSWTGEMTWEIRR